MFDVLLLWLLLNVIDVSCWQQRQSFKLHVTIFCIMIIFSFDKFSVVMSGIYANNLFQAKAFSKDYSEIV